MALTKKITKASIGAPVKKIPTKAQLMPTLDKLKAQIEVRINESKSMKEVAALRNIDVAVNSLIRQVIQYNKM